MEKDKWQASMQNREISPSKDAWDRLSAAMDGKKEKKRSYHRIVKYAAVLLLFFSVGSYYIFSDPSTKGIKNNTIVIEPKMESNKVDTIESIIKNTDPKEEDLLLTNSAIEIKNTNEEKSRKKSIKQTKKQQNSSAISTVTTINEHEILEDNKKIKTIVPRDTNKELGIASIPPKKNSTNTALGIENNIEEEVDALLLSAQIKQENLKEGIAKTDPTLLLRSVEFDLFLEEEKSVERKILEAVVQTVKPKNK